MILKTLHILLADDDTKDCFLFKEVLKELPFSTRLTVVKSGEELMQWLAEQTEGLPDVLFLDLVMPRKNGSECLSEIKSNEALKQLPVIIYSTSRFEVYADMLYQNGAHYYIRKPAEFSELKKIIHRALALVAQGNIPQPAKEYFVLTGELENH